MNGSKPRVKAPVGIDFKKSADIIKECGVNTICQSGSCPNIGECWSTSHAAFMILGDTCTRACAFCNVKTGKPEPVDPF